MESVGTITGVPHADPSSSAYSSISSCGVILPTPEHSTGKSSPGRTEILYTWYSLNNTRPHWFAAGAPTGVLKVNCMMSLLELSVAQGCVGGMMAVRSFLVLVRFTCP